MIYFIFISPDGFERLANGCNDHSGLRELKELLFPWRGMQNVFLADAYDPNWFRQVRDKVFRLREDNRNFAYSLLQQIKESGLIAWRGNATVPRDEQDWINVVLSQKPNLVNCILACYKVEDNEIVETVERLGDREWVNEMFPWSVAVRRAKEDQEFVLRKLLVNADWSVLELPYIRGESDDEIVTARQIIRLMAEKQDSVRTEVDLIVSADANFGNVAHWLREAVKNYSGIKLRVFGLEGTLNRSLLTGMSSIIAGGTVKRVPRWYVSMGHVAVGRDKPNQSNPWSLMSKSQAIQHWEHCREEMQVTKPAISLP